MSTCQQQTARAIGIALHDLAISTRAFGGLALKTPSLGAGFLQVAPPQSALTSWSAVRDSKVPRIRRLLRPDKTLDTLCAAFCLEVSASRACSDFGSEAFAKATRCYTVDGLPDQSSSQVQSPKRRHGVQGWRRTELPAAQQKPWHRSAASACRWVMLAFPQWHKSYPQPDAITFM
eukprot:2988810-Amphidinium_carterae.1